MAEKHEKEWPELVGRAIGVFVLMSGILLAAGLCNAAPSSDNSIPSMFDPRSTPAESIRHLSYFVFAITGLIFLVVFILLTYAVVIFRTRVTDAGREPAQVYGSTQIELASFAFRRSNVTARRLLVASIIDLPAILALNDVEQEISTGSHPASRAG